jgi:hypothetical protein
MSVKRCARVMVLIATTVLVLACGSSAGGPALPPYLCQGCGTDAECGGAGNRCLDLSSGVAACGIDCGASTCPSGFRCAEVAGGGRNCIPASGQCPGLTACPGGCATGERCDYTTGSCLAAADAGVDAAPPHVGPWPSADGDELDLGSVDHLRFVAVGDCQPEVTNGAYPTDVLTRVMQQMNATAPTFGVFLGDYMDVYPDNYERAVSQLTQFLNARRSFAPELYYVLGNHEKYGANLEAYRNVMTTVFYYSLRAQTPQGSVKLIVLADTRWEPNYQKPWAEAQLGRATTYTFVAHHYPSNSTDDQTGGDVPATLARYPITLELGGHHHRYDVSGRVVTVGIGGAPLAAGDQHWGFVRVEIQPDGRVQGTAYREDTGGVMDTFTVTP